MVGYIKISVLLVTLCRVRVCVCRLCVVDQHHFAYISANCFTIAFSALTITNWYYYYCDYYNDNTNLSNVYLDKYGFIGQVHIGLSKLWCAGVCVCVCAHAMDCHLQQKRNLNHSSWQTPFCILAYWMLRRSHLIKLSRKRERRTQVYKDKVAFRTNQKDQKDQNWKKSRPTSRHAK